MKSDSTVVSLRQPDTIEDPLTAILRSGARGYWPKLSRRKPRRS